jgi:hypothetical protein
MQLKTFPPFPERWTAELLKRCTGRELVIVIAKFGLEAIVQRIGDAEFADMIYNIIHQQ